MGISKKQFTLAAKAGLTREQAARFIGTAGQEPSPTEAYDKVGQLLKGRTPGQAMKQVEPTLKKPEPTATATAGIKPIEPEVSQAQPPAQPKTEATNATEMIKPVEQPKKFDKRKISPLINEKNRQNNNWKRFEEIDLGQQDPKNNTVFSLFEKGDNPFESIGKDFQFDDRANYINPWTSRVKLGIRKDASVRVIIHEMGHLIDHYVAKKSRTGNMFLSQDADFTNALNNIVDRFNIKDKNIEQRIVNFYKTSEAFHKEVKKYDYSKYEPGANEILQQYDKLSAEELSLSYKNFNDRITPEELKRYKELKPITIELLKKKIEIQNKYGFEAGADMKGAMDDIVSALTSGAANKSNNRLGVSLSGYHKKTYWAERDTKGIEIFTHYLTMKSHPDTKYINNFKKHFPEMDAELERLYDQAYQVMGGK